MQIGGMQIGGIRISDMRINDSGANRPPQKNEAGTVRLHWLGQAGFLLETRGLRILIDPYLSDSLAEKYAGKEFPHIRLMPAPIAPESLFDIDYVFASHCHTDHMDPKTLVPIQANNPGCRFIVPKAGLAEAAARGLLPEMTLGMDAGQRLDLSPAGGITAPAGETVPPAGDTLPPVFVSCVLSAHEDLQFDPEGHSRYLGFVFDSGGFALYHSGDCVPFPGLEESLTGRKIRLALLPVNGRDEKRKSKGILGNFSLAEAVDLARRIGCEYFIGHHFGLFDFNTIDREAGIALIESQYPGHSDSYLLAEMGIEYRFSV